MATNPETAASFRRIANDLFELAPKLSVQKAAEARSAARAFMELAAERDYDQALPLYAQAHAALAALVQE